MVDDTLLPIGFEVSKIAKTNLAGQERYAMACARAETKATMPQAAFVRHVLLLGLERLGWDEEKMIREYADYRVRCIRQGRANPYESE